MPPNPTCISMAGGCDMIRFNIIGSPGPLIVEATVQAVPLGFTIDDVPGFDTGMVLIYDPGACFFNEPAGQLMGRMGFARYMQPTDFDEGNQLSLFDIAYELVPHWEVFSLCCNLLECL